MKSKKNRENNGPQEASVALPDDFCIFILTHGRPTRVYTLNTLRSTGYAGRWYLVVDDEDKTIDEYRRIHGEDRVLVFSKKAVAATIDEGDNFGGKNRKAILYARNACFDLAKQVGCPWFLELDDDYQGICFRFDDEAKYGYWRFKREADHINRVLSATLAYYKSIPALTIAFSQGGDHIGGSQATNNKALLATRKAMNTFFCSTERPFRFVGRINEDVNTYTELQRRGNLFLTFRQVMIEQKMTQSNAGGMTDIYLDSGTYIKSFYTVMYAPSCTTIATIGEIHQRIHHNIDWNACAPRIVRESLRKPEPKPPRTPPTPPRVTKRKITL